MDGICGCASQRAVPGERLDRCASATDYGAQSYNPAPRLRERTLLYVGVPMKKGNTDARIPAGIYVFDVNDGFAFVKRIPTFEYPAWEDPMITDQVIGVAGTPTGKFIMSTFK